MIEGELAVVMTIGALIVGVGIGYLVLKATVVRKSRIGELELALESARGELKDYKREVFDQFGETAEKFRALNHSYEELHRQLANSAATLIGDAAMPLLDAPAEQALAQDDAVAAAEDEDDDAADTAEYGETVDEEAIVVGEDAEQEQDPQVDRADNAGVDGAEIEDGAPPDEDPPSADDAPSDGDVKQRA